MDYGHTSSVNPKGNSVNDIDNPMDNLNADNWNSASVSSDAPIISPRSIGQNVMNMGMDAHASSEDMPNIYPTENSATPDFVTLDTPNHSFASEAPEAPEAPVVASSPFQSTNPDALGRIMPVDGSSAGNNSHSVQAAPGFVKENIHTSGDYLDKSSMIEINRVEERLNQTHDLSSFYDDIRDMNDANIDNSFNGRKTA